MPIFEKKNSDLYLWRVLAPSRKRVERVSQKYVKVSILVHGEDAVVLSSDLGDLESIWRIGGLFEPELYGIHEA